MTVPIAKIFVSFIVYLGSTLIKHKFKREKHIYKLFNQKITFLIINEKRS